MQCSEGGASQINHNDALPHQNLEDGDDHFSSFPPGYRFRPTDDELLRRYLIPKAMRLPLPRNKIPEVKFYDHNPETLMATQAAAYENCGESHWYFFTPRSKKYPNGKRPSRSSADGFLNPTSADKK